MSPSHPDPGAAADLARQDQLEAAVNATGPLAGRIAVAEGAVRLPGIHGPHMDPLVTRISGRAAVCDHIARCSIQPGVTHVGGVLLCGPCYQDEARTVRVDPDAPCPCCSRAASSARGPLRVAVGHSGLLVVRLVLCRACIAHERHVIAAGGPP